MPFVPRVARPYLTSAAVADPRSPGDTLAPLRREALDVLGRAYASGERLAAGAVAWVLVVVAAVLGVLARDGAQASLADAVLTWLMGAAIVLGLAGALLGVAVVHAGSVLSRAVAAWLATPSRAGVAEAPTRSTTRFVLGICAFVAMAGAALLAGVDRLAGSSALGDAHVLLLGAVSAASGAAAVCLLSGVNRVRTAAWQPDPVLAERRARRGDEPAGTGQTALMLLVPSSAEDVLDPAEYRRDWTTYGSMTIRRQSALRTLLPAYTDLARLAVGMLAWVLGLTGAAVLRAGLGAPSSSGPTGTTVLVLVLAVMMIVLGGGVGVVVLLAGRRLSRGVALWALMPRLVDVDGNRMATGAPVPPDDRGSGELVGALGVRLLAAVVAAVAAIWWTVGVVRDVVATLDAYVLKASFGIALASAIGAAFSWTAAIGLARGWHRVRGALTGRTGRSQLSSLVRELHGPRPAGQRDTDRGAYRPPHQGHGHQAWQYQQYEQHQQYQYRQDAYQQEQYGQQEHGPQPRSPQPPQPHRSLVPQVRVSGRLLEPGTTVVGRSPVPRAGERIDHTVALDDRTLSKTHLSVRVSSEGVFLTDRASTNGTTIVTNQGEERLMPWQETGVPLGTKIRAGATELAVASSEPDKDERESEEDVEQTAIKSDRREM